MWNLMRKLLRVNVINSTFLDYRVGLLYAFWLLLYAGRLSHYTDTSEPVDGNEAQNVVTVHFYIRVSNQEPFDHWPSALTNCANRVHVNYNWTIVCPQESSFLRLVNRQCKTMLRI
jgi:hypothetical protein